MLNVFCLHLLGLWVACCCAVVVLNVVHRWTSSSAVYVFFHRRVWLDVNLFLFINLRACFWPRCQPPAGDSAGRKGKHLNAESENTSAPPVLVRYRVYSKYVYKNLTVFLWRWSTCSHSHWAQCFLKGKCSRVVLLSSTIMPSAAVSWKYQSHCNCDNLICVMLYLWYLFNSDCSCIYECRFVYLSLCIKY